MSKHSLLLVDGDTRSLRVLEVSLRKAGFTVTSARSVQDALDKLELGAPDLIISETTFPDGDGFELRRRVRASPDWAEIPFVFLTAEVAIENKIRGLELGVDDYLTKPIYIKEIVARINILLQKRQRARFEERRDGRMRFAGRVADMPVVDVIQTIEISRKSGVIQFSGEHNRQGAIYFREGKVIDAEAGALQGEDAVYRLLTWSEGDFEVVFRTVRRRDAISASSQGLLMEGMRRLDEWSRLLEQLPPLEHRFEIDTAELSIRLGEVPDDHNEILRLIDGKRTMIEVIDACQFGDLECLQAIARLYFEGLLIDLDHGVTARRNPGKPVPLEVVEETFLFPEAVSDTPSGSTLIVPAPEPVPAPAPSIAPAAPAFAPTELSGGYRPSTLRLIEEAVLAAQAVEPTLFEGADAPGVIEMARRVVREAAERALETEEARAIPQVINAEDPIQATPSDHAHAFGTGESPTHAINGGTYNGVGATSDADTLRASRDEALRMIGSLGHDRAEISGELAQQSSSDSAVIATQRELVTILPRRATREVPITLPPTTTTPPVVVPAVVDPEPPREIELPRPATAGGTRRTTGPSLGAIFLLLLAAVLVVLAIVARLHRGRDVPAAHDPHGDHAGLSTSPPTNPDNAPAPPALPSPPPTVVPPAALPVAAPPPAVVASTRVVPSSQPVPAIPVHSLVDTTPPISTDDQALHLMTAAKSAFDANRASDALELADRSLRLHRTTSTYLVRAQVLQRLGRTDDALKDLASATQLTPASSKAWETTARMLWSLRRWDDARPAMQRYLDLAPTGDSAAEFRHRLSEPK